MLLVTSFCPTQACAPIPWEFVPWMKTIICCGEVSSVRKGLCDIIIQIIIGVCYSWSLPANNIARPSTTTFTASLKWCCFLMAKPKIYCPWVFPTSLLAWRWLLPSPSAIHNATDVDPPILLTTTLSFGLGQSGTILEYTGQNWSLPLLFSFQVVHPK